MKHIVTFGEMLLRLSPPGHQRLLQTPELRAAFGGCEANVAVGLAQFGIPVRYVSALPDNPIGDAALRALRAEGVDVRGVVRSGSRVGVYYLESGADVRPLRSVYDRKHSSFAEASPESFDFDGALRDASWLHVSGIVPALGAGPRGAIKQAIASAKAAGVRVSFDLNFRPALWAGEDPKPFIAPLLYGADLLIGNPEAFSVMAGAQSAGTIPEDHDALLATAQRLHAMYGCAQVAVTQRETVSASTHAWQAWLWHEGLTRMHHGGRYEVQLVDRVGGGDAFVAGLLASLSRGEPANHAVRFGTAACAMKHSIPGDFPNTSTPEVTRLLETRFPRS